MKFEEYRPKPPLSVNIGGVDLELKAPKSKILPYIAIVQRFYSEIEKERKKKDNKEEMEDIVVPKEVVEAIIEITKLTLKNSYPNKDMRSIETFIDDNLEEIMQKINYFMGIEAKEEKEGETKKQ